MDLKDATLMLLTESAGHPALAAAAQSVYKQVARGDAVDYRVLNELLGEASGKGVLRALRAKYSPTAYEAIIMPIMAEIARQPPVGSRRRACQDIDPETDPLRASVWPPR